MGYGVTKTRSLSIIGLLLLAVTAAATGAPQSTAFNYQGRLTDANNPATGSYDMQFKLFDSVTVGTGTQQGATLTNPTVPVTAGSFSITLDFGANVFDGSARFLEISVRPAGSPNPYTVLSPRQPVNSSPYAVNALQLGGFAANRYVASDTNGNIGIGTQTPTARLTVSGAGAANAPGAPRFDLFNTTAGSGFVQHVTDSGLWQIASSTGATRMVIDPTGNVGIGSITPNTRLTLGGGVEWTAAGWTASMNMQNGSAFGWEANGSGQRFGIGQTGGGMYFFRTNSAFGNTGSPANYDMTITDTGNVGIGTNSPTSKVEIVAQDGLKITGFQPFMTLLDTNTGLRSLMAGGNGDFGFYPDSFIGGVPAVLIHNGSGNVGIGTTDPQTKLHVEGSGLVESTVKSINERAILALDSTLTGQRRVWTLESGIFGTSGLFGIYDRTAGLARLTIDTTGSVGIGTVSPTAKLHVVAAATGGSDIGVYGTSTGGTGVAGISASGTGVAGYSPNNWGVFGNSPNGAGVYGASDNGFAGYFQGNVHVLGTVTQGSDERLKQGISTLGYGLSEMLRLRPVTWRWKDHPERGPQLGLVAQEVEAVLPELVSTSKDAAQAKGLNYIGLLPVLVNAIKEQQAQIDQQQAQIRKQKAETETLRQELGQVKQQRELIRQQHQEMAAIKQLLCRSHPQAELCKAKSVK